MIYEDKIKDIAEIKTRLLSYIKNEDLRNKLKINEITMKIKSIKTRDPMLIESLSFDFNTAQGM